MVPKYRKMISLSVFLLSLLIVTTAFGWGTSYANQSTAAIRLKVAQFTPGLGERPQIPPGLAIPDYAQGQRGYYIVQFAGPVLQAWKDDVTAAGADILGYIPDFAFKVRMTSAQAAQVDALDSVAWVGIYQPAYKLDPALQRNGTHLYRVRIESGAHEEAAATAVARSGAQVLNRSHNTLVVAANSAQLNAIANVLDVAWVENFVFKEKHNDYGAGVILGANTANANGYDGSTQVVAVADTGIGNGTPSGAHPDIPAGRVTAIFDWAASSVGGCYTAINDGAADVDSGHGTHVSVSVLGDGGPSGEGKGTAPAASLIFQAVEDYADMKGQCALLYPDGYYLLGLPDDLHALYQQAYNAGARVHSNSWGSDAAGDYTQDSADTDDFVWNNQDMLITFSAGNDGFDNNADGVVDSDSTGSPATAKNVLTVGASENDRQGNYQCDTGLVYTSSDAYQTGQTCGSMGGNQLNFLGTWGQRYGFPTNPLKDDITAGNAEQMAAWSSRGPTDDGRIKPDVVAPGTWILSGYSGLYQEGYGDPVNPQNGLYQWDGWGMPLNVAYKHMGGTSMSNPIAAGAAAVVRDYYQEAQSHAASAALVKATLINSAHDMLDENNDGANDNDFPIPNIHEGWGRVDLVNATDGSHQYVDDAIGVSTGGTASHQFTVQAAGSALKVSLVWSDFASTAAAGANLVNDLNLVVTAPGGAQYKGNVFSGGWSQTGGSADNINNVENVYVQSAAAGTWTVQVSGANVPQGPQPFALVVDGDLGGQPDNPPTVSIVNPPEAATVSGTELIQIAVTDEDPAGTLTVEWNIDSGPWQPAVWNGTSGYYEANWDTTAVTDGAHTVNARATDSALQTGIDANNVTVQNTAPPDMHVGDLDSSTSTGRGGKWNATVTITIHDNSDNVLANATVNGSWSAGANGSDSCVTNSSGQCNITKNNINKNSSSVTFTVTNVTHSSFTYNASANHDPDGDSNGTSMVILKP